MLIIRPARFAAFVFLLGLTTCGKTGHLAETTYTPGTVVLSRGGRAVAELPTPQQQQLAVDIRECRNAAAVTVPNDRAALLLLAGAASGVLSAHGGGARLQGGINGAENGIEQSNNSDNGLTQEVREASDWRASDCLKSRGWDSEPRFMLGPVPHQ
jgi:hypothetical protein